MYIKKLLTGFELVGWLKRSFPRHQLERERKNNNKQHWHERKHYRLKKMLNLYHYDLTGLVYLYIELKA